MKPTCASCKNSIRYPTFKKYKCSVGGHIIPFAERTIECPFYRKRQPAVNFNTRN